MAFKLTKEEQATKRGLVTELQSAWVVLEDAKTEAEGIINSALEVVQTTANNYAEVAQRAEAFREEVANRLRAEWDEKSESWQEGERGQEVSELVEAWEGASLETNCDISASEIELGEDLAPTLDDLTTEA